MKVRISSRPACPIVAVALFGLPAAWSGIHGGAALAPDDPQTACIGPAPGR